MLFLEMKKKSSFVLTVRHILFIAFGAIKRSWAALETCTIIFQVSKKQKQKNSFKINEKLKGVN